MMGPRTSHAYSNTLRLATNTNSTSDKAHANGAYTPAEDAFEFAFTVLHRRQYVFAQFVCGVIRRLVRRESSIRRCAVVWSHRKLEIGLLASITVYTAAAAATAAMTADALPLSTDELQVVPRHDGVWTPARAVPLIVLTDRPTWPELLKYSRREPTPTRVMSKPFR